jgi:hypothetical protein
MSFSKLQDEMTGKFYCCWDWWIVAAKCPTSAPQKKKALRKFL